MMSRKRVGIDFRPALIGSSGIGRYTRELVRALPEFSGEFDVKLFSVFMKDVGPRLAPPGCDDFEIVKGRFPGRALQWLGRLKLMSVESFTGELDLMQTTDYVALPVRTKNRVATIHDLSFLREPAWYRPESRKRIMQVTQDLIRSASVITADSEATKLDLMEFMKVEDDKVVVAPLGCDERFYNLAPAPTGPPRLICCGTLEPRKNHLRLLEAFRNLREKIPEAELCIVGRRGWLDEEVVAALTMQNTAGLRWIAKASDDQLLAEMARANIVVYPSLWEGFGLPLLEGMAAGRASLSSDRGSMAEIARDAALLVNPKSVSEISEGLLALSRDESMRGDLARRGVERSRHFSWRRCAEKTVEAWHQAWARES